MWGTRASASAFKLAIALLSALLAPAAPPNIVLFYVDDLGWKDVGYQGGDIFDTPNIDRLAAEGMRFTDAYSACPVCSPSRAALMTGKTPARVGFTGHITAIGRHRYPENARIIPPDDHMDLPHSEVTLAEALKPAGYVSASIGKWHLGTSERHWPRAQGFDLNVAGHTEGSPAAYFFPYTRDGDWNAKIENLDGGEPGEYLTDRLTDEAIAFIRESRSQPFLLYLPHYSVHTPLEAPEELVEKYRSRFRFGSPIDPTYAAMVERTDHSLGRILAILDNLGLTDNTVVIFTSDNGGLSTVTDNRPLRAGKGFLYEGGIRVPLVIRWPGRTSPGSVSSAPVITHDLYATIVDIAGGTPGEIIDGVRLAPLLTSGRLPERDLYWYYPHYSPQAKQPGAALRAGRYKLIEHYDPPRIELYDLEADIGETNDLADRMPTRRESMRARLRERIAEAGAIRHTPNRDYMSTPQRSAPPRR